MFIEKLLQIMAEKKASDIFISAGSPISIKIQGNIMPVNPQPVDAEMTKKIAYEMLTPKQIETFERDQELNFSKPMAGLGNFRVNFFWQKGAVSGVIRYVSSDIPKIADLSLPQVLSTLVMEKRGLILVVGATGSGKSTTLASMLDFRNGTSTGHILTIEDPVEYVFLPKKSIFNQREVGNDTRSFHDALRNAMPMLLQDLSVSLKAVISQRLIKTIDGKRTPAVEVLLNTRNIQELIEKGEINEIKEAMEKSMSPGSQTFEQDLFRLVRQGKISVDEALGNADSATNLGLLLGNSGIMPAMAEKAKMPGATRSEPSPFGGIEISEESEERL